MNYFINRLINLFKKIGGDTKVYVVKDRVSLMLKRCEHPLYGNIIKDSPKYLAESKNTIKRIEETLNTKDAKVLSKLLLEFGRLQTLFVHKCDEKTEAVDDDTSEEKEVYKNNLSDLEDIFKVI